MGLINLMKLRLVNNVNIFAVDEFHLKSDYIEGSIANGEKQPILSTFA